MDPTDFFTRILGIAPLREMPKGVKTARIRITKSGGCSDALEKLSRSHPNLVRPYWQIATGAGGILALVVVTEPDAERLRVAMKETGR